jgi:hypothetical protein
MENINRTPRDKHCNPSLGIYVRGSLWTLSLTIALLCLGCPRSPDLTDCTHIELRYRRGAVDHFILYERLLNEEEERYVRSLDTTIVSDRELIKAFAQSLNEGIYCGRQYAETTGGVDVLAYRGADCVASFTVYRGGVLNRDRSYFRYPMDMPDLTVFESPRIKNLKTRGNCALHLSELRSAGLLRHMRPRPPYPDPNQWCDAVLSAMREHHSIDGHTGQKRRMYDDGKIARMFRCPSSPAIDDMDEVDSYRQDTGPADHTVYWWQSDYAINPNCRIDSAPDTVLLFEAKPGWNQHGGPELFTFDNHDPKGGVVLLNDGTVRFIRTAEELKQLRWK